LYLSTDDIVIGSALIHEFEGKERVSLLFEQKIGGR